MNTKRNLTCVKPRVHAGITKLQANIEKGETFQNRQQGKTVTNLFQNLSFRKFS